MSSLFSTLALSIHTSGVLQPLYGGGENAHTPEETAALLLDRLLVVPHGDGDAVAVSQIQIEMIVPLGVQRGLARLGGVHLIGPIHGDLGEGIGQSWVQKRSNRLHVGRNATPTSWMGVYLRNNSLRIRFLAQNTANKLERM